MPLRVAILGSGLIGCSLALALRAAGRASEIVVYDRDAAAAERACALRIADRCTSTAAAAVEHADIVVLAAPVGAIAQLLTEIAPRLSPVAVVTDVGSTKRDVVTAAREILGDAVARFVPGHPIAGRERHGPDAAQVELFRGRRVLLTPLPENSPDTVAIVRDLWSACGAIVETIDPVAHDVALSAVSHLPHLLAYALVAQIADAPDAALKFGLAGGGFRDFTRIAASSPAMWRDIALANRDALLADLDDYRGSLDRLRAAVDARDGAALESLFTRASDARRQWRE